MNPLTPGSRFDAAEAELDRGTPWRYREPGTPNPITLEVTGWSSGHTKRGDAEFLNGVDRDGNPWSVLVGSTVLRRRLIDGEVSEWDEERGCYVVTQTLGRAKPGEIVSIRYLGEKESAAGNTYADFAVARHPAKGPADPQGDPDIPFDRTV